ncbi:unnamed protein product [Didymodactylos carnosus]|uniref:Uncharacterized protein n=1 Tax=Didymodactylos carnosus TaxID=1234261 RepID=A0A8S2KIQ4_9BILA|nr:unnamed protein product [Didymodactylos carnosus]CAF3850890.1 unnamed protein product [Didymodactylos carnosus]
MDLTHLYPFMQAAATTVNTTTPQFTMPSQTHYQQRNTNILVSPTQSSKRPRDFYDQEDLKSHSSRLAARITKHGLHNYGLAMDLYDAIARTLIPYVEYNERFKLKFMKQIHLDTMVTVPSGFSDIAQHVRTRLQMLCDEYSSNTNGLVETKTSAITNETSKTNAMDLISGAPSVYLENSQHGKVIQMLANILGIEIRLVTSYVYEEIISVQPHDILEKEPLYIAYNDVSKQYYMVDKPTNIRRDELSNHQYCLEQLIQKYHLNVVPKSSLGLSLFSATAQSLKNISIKNPIVESVVRKYFNMNGVFENELAVLLRDMTYKQLKSNFDYYETYVQIKPKHFDIRRDSKSLIDCTYYRYQLEKVVLYALAHVIQCNMIVFSSDVKQAKPDVIRVDPSMDNNKDIIILLKNESTQHYDSAVPNYSLRNLIGTITSNESLVNGNRHAQHSNVNQQSEKTSASNKASMDDPIYESIDPSSPVPDISLPPAAPPTNSNTYYRQLSVPASNTRSNDTYVGATMPTNSNEKKGDLKSKFFSKTKEKFVTAFNKVVENGSLPKKPQVYRNNGQSLNNLFAPTQIGATSSSDRYIEHRPSLEIKDYSTLVQTPLQSSNIPSVKRQAPIAEVIRRQQQQQLIENNTYQNTQPRNLSESDIISLSQQNKHSRPVNNQSQTSIRQPSEIPRATENTRDHLIPYKDRQRSKITLNMSSNSAVKKGNIYNSVTLEDVDDSTEEIDFTNSLTDDDTVILRDVNQQNTVDRQKSNVSKVKTGSHHYDHDTLTRQQQSRYVDDDFTDEESENDIRQYDDVKRLLSENDSTTTDPQQAEDEEEEDIYISTTDIVQRDKKQLQLFVSDKINHFNHLNCSPSLNDRKLSTSSLSNKDVKRSNDTRKKQYIHDLTNVELRRPKDQQRSETTTAMCKDSQNEVVDSHRQLKSGMCSFSAE